MKNAYVLEHHFGDDGNVAEGVILTDMSEKRFHALEKLGIIREATADEVKVGTVITFVTDEEQRDAAPAVLEFADFENLRTQLQDSWSVIEELRLEIDHLHKNYDEREGHQTMRVKDLTQQLQTASERHADLEQSLVNANARADAAEKKVREMELKADETAASKTAPAAQNKLAPTPENKAAKSALKTDEK